MSLDFTHFEKLYATPTAAAAATRAHQIDAFEKSGLLGAISTIAMFQGGSHKKASYVSGIIDHEIYEYTSKRGGLTFTSHYHSYTMDADCCHDVTIAKGADTLFRGSYTTVDPSYDEDGRSEIWDVSTLNAAALLAAKRDITHVLSWQNNPPQPRLSKPTATP